MVVVVAYHARVPGAVGGYLGVSTFFTLSGFLIATLLLREHATSGRIDLRSFWRRRIRRLLPAAAATLALVAVLAAVASTGAVGLRGDVVASSLYVQNWHLLANGTSYAAQFAEPSPLTHLWSLAVEEQFYVVFPLLTFAVIAWKPRRLGGPARRLAAVAVAVAGAAVVAPYLWAHRSGTDAADRVYYGTDTRAGEIAIGVLLAAVVYRAVTDGERIGPRTRRTVSIVSTLAAAVMLVALVTVPATSAMWTKGGFVAYGVLSALIVAAAALEIGPVGALGRSRVLRRLGVLSYTVYLLHWPLLWLADQALTWPAPVMFGAVLAVSVAGAGVSHRFFEQPLRLTGRLGPIPLTAVIAAGVVVAVSGASLASTGPGDTIDFAAARADLAVRSPAAAVARTEADSSAARGTQTLESVATVPTRIAFYGDSTAVMTGKGVKSVVETRAATGDGSLQVVPGGAELGCGIMIADHVRTSGGTVGAVAQKCLTWPARWAATIAADDPDIAVVQVGPWETFDLAWDGTDGWHHLGDPVADQHARDLIATAIDELAAGGAHVVFLTATAPAPSETPNPNGPCSCPERIERWNQLVEEVAAEHPLRATVVDLAGWLAAQDPAEARRLLADGVHFSETTAREVAERWLIERITIAGSRS